MHCLRSLSRVVLLSVLPLTGSAGADEPLDHLRIQTVRGVITGDQLGLTLTHEHVLVDFGGADETGPHRWDRQEVIDLTLPHLLAARDAGATAFVECTPAYLGRDVEILAELAERTGLHVLTPTGFYGARDGMFVPSQHREASPRRLADLWIAEHRSGIDGTDIRPGFIKIAVHGERDPKQHDATGQLLTLNPLDRRLVEAAGLTHRATGLTIACHTAGASGFEALDLLDAADVPADAFIWVHSQHVPIELALDAARRGAWISYDNFKAGQEQVFLDRLRRFRDADLLDRVLLSHDAGWYRVGEPGGAPGKFRGYTALLTDLLPALRDAGFTDEEVRQLVVVNPARAYALRPQQV